MGIRGFLTFLKKKYPQCILEISISALSGHRLAIDAYVIMYACMSVARKRVLDKATNQELLDNQVDHGEIRRVWLGLLFDGLMRWLNNNITPILVFDGTPLEAKLENLQDRNQKFVLTQQKINGLQATNNPQGIRQAQNDLLDVTHEDCQAFQSMLKALGIKYLRAPDDAERLCASLCADKLVAAVYSKDSDTLLFGSPVLITEVKQSTLTVFRLDLVLGALGLSFAQLVDLGIMCGCDFNNNRNIKDIGPVNALAYIQKYQSLDVITQIIDTECLKYPLCRQVFQFKHTLTLIPSVPALDCELNFQIGREFLLEVGLVNSVDNWSRACANYRVGRAGWCAGLGFV